MFKRVDHEAAMHFIKTTEVPVHHGFNSRCFKQEHPVKLIQEYPNFLHIYAFKILSKLFCYINWNKRKSRLCLDKFQVRGHVEKYYDKELLLDLHPG